MHSSYINCQTHLRLFAKFVSTTSARIISKRTFVILMIEKFMTV